jgi:hypothetical protein
MRNLLTLLIVLTLFSAHGRGQTPSSSPMFEVATIKPSGPASAPMSIQRLPGGRLITSNTPLTMLIMWLATVLSNQLGRPVQNKTGFDGRFEFTLRWAPDTAVVPAVQDGHHSSRLCGSSSGSDWTHRRPRSMSWSSITSRRPQRKTDKNDYRAIREGGRSTDATLSAWNSGISHCSDRLEAQDKAHECG